LQVFSPQNILGGSLEFCEFWKLVYKIEAISDHVAKFNGDQLMELGDLMAK